MRGQSVEEIIEGLLEPLLEERGLVLVDLELKSMGKRKLLRVFVDRKEGEVTLDDCADLSRELSFQLDVRDPIAGPYVLEVSSPGLNRTLKKPREFRWALGKKVRVLSSHGDYSGTLLSYSDGEVEIEKEGEVMRFSPDEVLKVKLNEVIP